MSSAAGFLETTGLTPALAALDSMIKAAPVRILQVELNDLRGVVVKFAGPVDAVQAALAAGREVALRMRGSPVAHHVASLAPDAEPAVLSPPEYNPLIHQQVVFATDSPDAKTQDQECMTDQTNFALGLLETQGFTAVFEAVDTACKAANVQVVGKEKLGGGYVTVVLKGDLSAVTAAVEAGRAKVDGLGILVAAHVIARPSQVTLRWWAENHVSGRPGPGSKSLAAKATRLLCPAGACLVVLSLAGCAQFKKDPPPADPAGRYVQLTRPIIAAGDTQEHETTGFPLIDNDGAVDAYVEVAQRPPEQPLFGRRVGEWVLVNHPGVSVLHMGDVLDMSCRSELERIWALGKAATQPIAILPGNHDGLMFGIFNLPVFGDLAEKTGHAWYRGSLRGAEESATDARRTGLASTVDRRTFISTYLTSVATIPEPVPGLAPVPETGRVRISWRNPRPDPYIEAIEVNLQDGDAYANSFLAQKLRLPAADGAPRGVVIIGLDTNQVGVAVGTLGTIRSLSPGDIGHVRADQLAAIRHWIEGAQRSGDIVVFAGHHNWNRLSFASQARIAGLFEGIDHPLVYLSAHTHQGFWAMHWVGERRLLELNMSSLSDWPIAYRRISFALDAKANRLKVVADLMPDAGVPAGSDQALLESWEAVTCRPTGIASMRITEEELQVVPCGDSQNDARRRDRCRDGRPAGADRKGGIGGD